MILTAGWLCWGCFLPQEQRLAGCVPCAARARLSCSCCPALCPLTGHTWQGPRGCSHPAPTLHAKVHSKGRARHFCWQHRTARFLVLLSPRQLFTCAGRVHAGLYGCRGKESLNASFRIKGWQCLSRWSWTLLCSVAFTHRAQGRGNGHRALMCCLEGSALPVPAGAIAPGTGTSSLLWDLQPGSVFSFGGLGLLRSSFLPHRQLCSWENL